VGADDSDNSDDISPRRLRGLDMVTWASLLLDQWIELDMVLYEQEIDYMDSEHRKERKNGKG